MTTDMASLVRFVIRVLPVIMLLLRGGASRDPLEVFDTEPTGVPPADAAYHLRASAPEASLHLMTQYVNDDVRSGKNHSTGRLDSGRNHYDLTMHFHVELDDKLAPLDNLAVSHFEGPNEFHMDTEHHRVRVGAVLLGTHNGN